MTDYKKTLIMPSTDFSMKANLNTKEEQFQKFWLDQDVYQKVLKQNKNNQQWVLHDGPPYANGNIHVGHATNKILKDFIVRIKNMQGYYSPYIPGWDTHGLPIEAALQKTGKNKDPNLTATQKRLNCKNFAKEQYNNQLKQFARLGLLTDWKDIYLTYNQTFEIDQLNVFVNMVYQNLVFRAKKPVYWSWSSQTALAEAEIVYDNRESHSIYLAFPLVEKFKDIPGDTSLVIWTTTPFTLLSNLAVAVQPNLNYHLLQTDQGKFLVVENRVKDLSKLLKWTNVKTLKTYLGKELEYLKYQNPLLNEEHFVVLGDYVSDADGSGLVHNAPGFGLDDYIVCKEYNIEPYCPVDNYGKFTNEVKKPEFEGMFYEDVNPKVVEILKNQKVLLHHEIITHSVAHDWRTHKPLIYRATYQWFVSIDSIKAKIVSATNQIKSYPKWVLTKLNETVLNRKEWCISRQRLWGVPIPILFDGNNEPILDLEQIKYTVEVLTQKGVDAWFSEPATTFLSPAYSHLKNVTKSTDTMDVWFDSGTSYNVLKHHNLPTQADLYLEGSDQFRGWFNSSLITSVILNNRSPYKNLISHGFLLDEKGLKMSKSKGNVIDPLSVCQTLGADILRLWVASTDYTVDMRLGNNALEQTANFYRKIRNTIFRFSLANLANFDPKKDLQKNLSLQNAYILNELNKTLKKAVEYFNNYAFYKAIKLLGNFLNLYSSWYLDTIKDILYCDDEKSARRLEAQTVLYYLLEKMLILLAPILPHTTEEAYQVFNKLNKKDSIHLESWVEDQDLPQVKVDSNQWEQFFKIKDVVYEKIENLREAGIIKKSTDVDVVLNLDCQKLFSAAEWKILLQVAHITFSDVQTPQTTLTKLDQCLRCRLNYVQEEFKPSGLCARCDQVINK